MMGPDYVRPKVDTPAAFRFEPQGRRRHRQHRMVETVRRPGARRADRRGAGQQPERADRRRQRRTGRRRVHADALAAVSAGRLRREPVSARDRPKSAQCRRSRASSRIRRLHTRQCWQASWEIDLWGRIRRLTESARANALATDDARRGVILSLVASVANDYIQLRGLDEQLAVSKATLGTYDESVKLFELQFKYGQVSQMNVEQARSQYETAAAQIPQIESQIAQTENALSILLGRNPGPIPRGKSLDALVLPDVPAGLPSQLLERRPDLMQSEEQLIAANAQIGAAKASVLSDDLADGRLRQRRARTCPTCSPVPHACGATRARSPDRSSPAAQSAARWCRPRPRRRQRCSTIGCRSRMRSATSTTRWSPTRNCRSSSARRRDWWPRCRTIRASRACSSRAATRRTRPCCRRNSRCFPPSCTLASVRAQVFASSVNIYKAMGGGWVALADTTTTGGDPPFRSPTCCSSRRPCSDAARVRARAWRPQARAKDRRSRIPGSSESTLRMFPGSSFFIRAAVLMMGIGQSKPNVSSVESTGIPAVITYNS